MNLFDGLEKFGFKDIVEKEVPVDIFAKAKRKKAVVETKPVVVALEDCLYQKTYECPVCYITFSETTVKKGKVRFVSSDTDLKATYEPLDPQFYDIVMCKKCGYTALSSMFPRISERQGEKILEQITPKYVPKEYPMLLSLEMAIERYKFALFNAMVKNSKTGEKAYLCLKLAWLHRDSHKYGEETMYLENAYRGLVEAFSTEAFPICGMDEDVVAYIIADIARRLGYYDVSLRWAGSLASKKTINPRIKEKLYDLKILVKQDMDVAQAKK